MHRAWILAGLLALVVGCSASSTTAPAVSSLDVTGTWIGTVSFQNISAKMTWQLTETGSNVTGPVTIALSDGTVLLNGFLTGSLPGSSLSYTVAVGAGGIPTQPTCVGQLSGTMAATASTLSGSFGVASSSCTVPLATTSVTLTKS